MIDYELPYRRLFIILLIGVIALSLGDVDSLTPLGGGTGVNGSGMVKADPISGYLVNVTAVNNSYTHQVLFANHSESREEGNWVRLFGGHSFDIPSLTVCYRGVSDASFVRGGYNITVESYLSQEDRELVYPLPVHQYYFEGDEVNATFYGSSQFADKHLDIRLVKAAPTEIRELAEEALRGDVEQLKSYISEGNTEMSFTRTLDGDGDCDVSFSAPSPGTYVLYVVNETATDDSYRLEVYSSTVVEVLDHSCSLTAPTSVVSGEPVDLVVTLNTSSGSTRYRYGGVLIHESAYEASVELASNGTIPGTNLTVNGEPVLNGTEDPRGFNLVGLDLGELSVEAITEKINSIVDEEYISLGFTNPTNETYASFPLETEGLQTGRYKLLTGVWDLQTGRKLVGFQQRDVMVDPEGVFPVTVTARQDGEIWKILFANHSESLEEGNWVRLSGGTSIQAPRVTASYNGVPSASYVRDGRNITVEADFTQKTVTTPFTQHTIYTEGDEVNATFYGSSRLVDKTVDMYMIQVSPTRAAEIGHQAFRGDIQPLLDLINSEKTVAKKTEPLDGEKDCNVQFQNLEPGSYILAVAKKITEGDATEYRVFSGTAVEILEHRCTVTKPTRIRRGRTVDVDIELVNATPSEQGYRYGGVLIHESAYEASVELASNGTIPGTNLTINDIRIVNGTTVWDGIQILDLLTNVNLDLLTNATHSIIDEDMFSLALSEKTSETEASLTLTTDRDMPTGTYKLLTGVWDYNLKRKVVGFNQTTLTIRTAPPVPVPNRAPVADAGPDRTVYVNQTVTFDASESYDPDGSIVSYSWDFGDGDTGTGLTATHTYDETGVYTVSLTVTDDDDATGTDTAQVTVEQPPINKPPVARAGASRRVFVNRTVNLNGAASSDPDGAIVHYEWDFGDGVEATGVRVTHSYSQPGEYTVSLTVEDDVGARNTDTLTVTVETPPIPPVFEVEEPIPANQTRRIDAIQEADSLIEVNTTDEVTAILYKYPSNPHPEAPQPRDNVPKHIDISVSNPQAVRWPIYIEIHYTEEELGDIPEAELALYHYYRKGEEIGGWQMCSDTGVDTERNVVWAYLTEKEAAGSPITIGKALAPPEFKATMLTIEPEKAEPGKTVTVSALITNRGEQRGEYKAVLKVNGVEVDSQTLALEAGEEKQAVFKVQRTKEDTYNIDLAGLKGSFTVEKPPRPAEFQVTDLKLTPTEVKPGEEVTAQATVKNIGEETNSTTVEIKLDGVKVDEATLTLDGGASQKASFKVTSKEKGVHKVNVDGLEAEFQVKPKPFPWTTVTAITIIIIIIAAITAYYYYYTQKK